MGDIVVCGVYGWVVVIVWVGLVINVVCGVRVEVIFFNNWFLMVCILLDSLKILFDKVLISSWIRGFMLFIFCMLYRVVVCLNIWVLMFFFVNRFVICFNFIF